MASKLCRARLGELLTEARSVAASELRARAGVDPVGDNGEHGRLALFVQGYLEEESAAMLKLLAEKFGNDRDWRAVMEGGEVASVVSYGLPQRETELIGEGLVGRGLLNFWECDLMLVEAEEAERLRKVRKRMASFRNRIELCGKIVCALEGKGPKHKPELVDSWKTRLQKAEKQAKDADIRRRKSMEAASKREKKRQENATKIAEKLHKEKKRASKSAQFMARFLKPKPDLRRGRLSPSKTLLSMEKDGLELVENPKLSRRPVYAADTVAGQMMNAVLFFSQKEIEDRIRYFNQGVLRDRYERESGLAWLLKRASSLRKKALGTISDNGFVPDRSKRRGRSPKGDAIKLLQFDGNHRPPFFGTMSNVSRTSVGARRPFGKDSSLDYDYDSDAEWEEDEPGESLSDCDDCDEEEAEMEDSGADDDDFIVKDDVESDIVSLSGLEVARNVGGENDSRCSNPCTPSDVPHDPDVMEYHEKEPYRAAECSDGNEVTFVGMKRRQSLMEAARNGLRKRSISACKKPRRQRLKELIVSVTGVIFDETPNRILDQYPVVKGYPDAIIDHPEYKEDSYEKATSDKAVQSSDKASPGKPGRRKVLLDAEGQNDLARLLHCNPLSREKIVDQFCEKRRAAGNPIPKTEVNRRISELAHKRKRGPHATSAWYLKDDNLIKKLRVADGERVAKSSVKSCFSRHNAKGKVATKVETPVFQKSILSLLKPALPAALQAKEGNGQTREAGSCVST